MLALRCRPKRGECACCAALGQPRGLQRWTRRANVYAQGEVHVPAEAEVTLIIPVYDEEHTIVSLVDEIKRCVQPTWRALIIYDQR
jgi:hypothetical protein